MDVHSAELQTATVGVALEVGQLLSSPKVSVTLVSLVRFIFARVLLLVLMHQCFKYMLHPAFHP